MLSIKKEAIKCQENERLRKCKYFTPLADIRTKVFTKVFVGHPFFIN